MLKDLMLYLTDRFLTIFETSIISGSISGFASPSISGFALHKMIKSNKGKNHELIILPIPELLCNLEMFQMVFTSFLIIVKQGVCIAQTVASLYRIRIMNKTSVTKRYNGKSVISELSPEIRKTIVSYYSDTAEHNKKCVARAGFDHRYLI